MLTVGVLDATCAGISVEVAAGGVSFGAVRIVEAFDAGVFGRAEFTWLLASAEIVLGAFDAAFFFIFFLTSGGVALTGLAGVNDGAAATVSSSARVALAAAAGVTVAIAIAALCSSAAGVAVAGVCGVAVAAGGTGEPLFAVADVIITRASSQQEGSAG